MEELVFAIIELSKHDWFDYLQFGIEILSSIIAIGVAIYIPTKIANKEQKIALFSYRLDCIKNLGKIFSYVDIIKIKLKNFAKLEMQTAFKLINDMNIYISKIHDLFNLEYQYIFNDDICSKIKFTRRACTEIQVELYSLEESMCNLQRSISKSKMSWYESVKIDKDICLTLNKINEICDTILLLEDTITQETYKVMNLKEL